MKLSVYKRISTSYLIAKFQGSSIFGSRIIPLCIGYSAYSTVLKIIFDRNIVETCGFHHSTDKAEGYPRVLKSDWSLLDQSDFGIYR